MSTYLLDKDTKYQFMLSQGLVTYEEIKTSSYGTDTKILLSKLGYDSILQKEKQLSQKELDRSKLEKEILRIKKKDLEEQIKKSILWT